MFVFCDQPRLYPHSWMTLHASYPPTGYTGENHSNTNHTTVQCHVNVSTTQQGLICNFNIKYFPLTQSGWVLLGMRESSGIIFASSSDFSPYSYDIHTHIIVIIIKQIAGNIKFCLEKFFINYATSSHWQMFIHDFFLLMITYNIEDMVTFTAIGEKLFHQIFL